MLMFRKEVGAERTTAVSHSKIAHPQRTDSSITFNIPWESSLHHPCQVLVAGLCLPVSEILMWKKIWLSGIIPSIRSLVKGHRPLAFLHQSYYCLTAASLLPYGRNTTPLDTWKACSSFLCAWSWWALGALFLFSAKTHVSGGPMTCVPVPTATPSATATPCHTKPPYKPLLGGYETSFLSCFVCSLFAGIHKACCLSHQGQKPAIAHRHAWLWPSRSHIWPHSRLK